MGDKTRMLLEHWHQGDEQALGELIERNLGWIRGRVQKRLGGLLAAKGQTTDYVQDAMVEVLRYGPKFVMSDEAQFRALVSKVIENVLRGRHDWFTAQRRDAARERGITGTVLNLDPQGKTPTRPSQAFARAEEVEMARLAVALLDEADREVVVLREWDGLTFREIAEQLDSQEETVRRRFQRALPKLADKVRLIRNGRFDTLVAD